jgi:hypothetical protein
VTEDRADTLRALGTVPWWGLASATAAPVLLAGGWVAAAGLQPPSYDAVSSTVSALAASWAVDRWVMTAAFVVVAACHLVTALALRPAAAPGRLVLAVGAAAGMMVAANPEQPGGSVPHALWAAVGLSALTLWPAGAFRRGLSVPWGLHAVPTTTAVTLMAALLAWFTVEVVTAGALAGLAERALGEVQALWPLLVVASCRLDRARQWPLRAAEPADAHPWAS